MNTVAGLAVIRMKKMYHEFKNIVLLTQKFGLGYLGQCIFFVKNV